MSDNAQYIEELQDAITEKNQLLEEQNGENKILTENLAETTEQLGTA